MVSKPSEDFARWLGEQRLDDAEVHRRNLMGQLGEGEITVDAAEASRRELGFPPLNSPPDPTKFDPMALLAWPLPMALAWIMWRSPDDVRRHWIEYRAQCHYWRSFERVTGKDRARKLTCHELLPVTPRMSSFWFLQNDERMQRDAGNPPRHSAKDAENELWRMLMNGELVLTAIPVGAQMSVTVPKEQFDRLVIPELADESGGDTLHLNGVVVYTEPRVRVDRVLHTWPDVTDPESNCQRWLESLMRKSPEFRPKTRLEFQTDALGSFEALTAEAFGRAWKNAITATCAYAWSRAGRPAAKSSGKSARK